MELSRHAAAEEPLVAGRTRCLVDRFRCTHCVIRKAMFGTDTACLRIVRLVSVLIEDLDPCGPRHGKGVWALNGARAKAMVHRPLHYALLNLMPCTHYSRYAMTVPQCMSATGAITSKTELHPRPPSPLEMVYARSVGLADRRAWLQPFKSPTESRPPCNGET